ncbi:hypothetical protein GQ55_3G400300 [Panicum hallii var. hallii]|uniref:DUF4408 domain-containing protein n=1 Tax=Panicum hallii var. hallii TaxID=1504633 RepID=A0A2T7EGV5_9POAL|nr:hypothetical protein GQ55_3G400300 [Panicum hallii var. hallii]
MYIIPLIILAVASCKFPCVSPFSSSSSLHPPLQIAQAAALHVHSRIQAMDFHSRMKAILVALTFLSMVALSPNMYTYLRAFFMESLPPVVSAVVTPKCLFVFSNIIVVFLISESKLSRANIAARNESVLNGYHKQEEVLVTEALLPAIPEDTKQGLQSSMVMEVGEEQDAAAVNEALKMDQQCEDEVIHAGVYRVDELQTEVEEEVSAGVGQDCSAEEELEERGLPPADELNRRVEDFIARFNMERQLEEAQMLECCC